MLRVCTTIHVSTFLNYYPTRPVTDEEKHNGIPIYCSNNFAKFVDDNTISEEEYQKLSGETVAESQAKNNEKPAASGGGAADSRIALDNNI